MPTSSKHTNHSKLRLAEKTVQELRSLAKSLGLTKYSKLAKAQLLRLIEKAAPPAKMRAAEPKTSAPAHKKAKIVQRPASSTATRTQTLARKPRPADRQAPPLATSRAPARKITSPPAIHATADDGAPGLHKTLPRPPVGAPMLTLRGQKPGVVHVAWNIDPARSMPLPFLRLRISTMGADNAGIIDEIPLPDLQGSRYFHLASDSGDGPLRAEIGYHSSDGRFIVMRQHADVRLPRRQAAGRGDPQWWISEPDFRELYLRSGGIIEGSALVWNTSISSR